MSRRKEGRIAFWNWRNKEKKQAKGEPVAGEQEEKPDRAKRPDRTRQVPLEVKLLALEGLEAGLGAEEVGALARVSDTSVNNWRRAYEAKGLGGLVRHDAARPCRWEASGFPHEASVFLLASPRDGPSDVPPPPGRAQVAA